MSVYKKMHQVQAATRSLAANTEGQTGAAKYNYVSGAKLLGVIRPLMDKLGLILTQEVVDIKNEPITYMTRNGEKTEMFTTAHIRFTWVDTDDGSQVVNDFFANGMNAWDKGLGSALTYAERYYLMKTFHIATDEDDVDALVKDEAIKPQPSQAVQARRAASGRSSKEQTYKPLAEDAYWKIVEAYANGRPTKTGGDYRETWIQMTHAGQEQITKFDHDVENYRLGMNSGIQPL
jgi:hypothetical protein